jgi:hypothetical protein
LNAFHSLKNRLVLGDDLLFEAFPILLPQKSRRFEQQKIALGTERPFVIFPFPLILFIFPKPQLYNRFNFIYNHILEQKLLNVRHCKNSAIITVRLMGDMFKSLLWNLFQFFSIWVEHVNQANDLLREFVCHVN